MSHDLITVDWTAFIALRQRVLKLIGRALKLDGIHKPYEGAFELHMPGYFGGALFGIVLHCYVLGPARHYEWTGATLAEAVDAAHKEIDTWEDELAGVEDEGRPD